MKTLNYATTLAALTTALTLLQAPQDVMAIDPLPPDIERAPLEVQADYLRQLGARSWNERTNVAMKRHRERLAQRQEVVNELLALAEQRRAEMAPVLEQPVPAPAPSPPQPANGWATFVVALICGGLVLHALRKHAFASEPRRS